MSMSLKSRSNVEVLSDYGKNSAAANQSAEKNMDHRDQGDLSGQLFKNELTSAMMGQNDVGTLSNYDKY